MVTYFVPFFPFPSPSPFFTLDTLIATGVSGTGDFFTDALLGDCSTISIVGGIAFCLGWVLGAGCSLFSCEGVWLVGVVLCELGMVL